MRRVDAFGVQFDHARTVVPDVHRAARHVPALDYGNAGTQADETRRGFTLVRDAGDGQARQHFRLGNVRGEHGGQGYQPGAQGVHGR